MDGSIHAASTQQTIVGGIDDALHIRPGDVHLSDHDAVFPRPPQEIIESTQDCPQVAGQIPAAGFLQRVGDAIKAFRYAASNGSQSIAVTAQRNGRADNVLKTLPSKNAVIASGTVSMQDST